MQVYVDLFAAAILMLGGVLACYGKTSNFYGFFFFIILVSLFTSFEDFVPDCDKNV